MRTHSGTLARVKPPEVLSFREFRSGLAATFRQVQEPDADPVYVGAHRRAEAVVMSVSHYRHLVEAGERREAVAEALASVRAEGLELSAEGQSMMTAIADGAITGEQGIDELRRRYQR